MLTIEHLRKSFGGVAAINDVSLHFEPGSLTAVIGPNGAGKTTFFNIITGAYRPDAGRVVLGGEDIAGLPAPVIMRRGMGRAFQVASIFASLTVKESILGAVNAHRRDYAQLLRRFPLARAQAQADEVMELVGLSARAHVLSGNLSHGDQKLLDIGLALALEPQVLLLDEPTAGMGHEDIERVAQLIKRVSVDRTVLMVEHNLSVVADLSDHITVLTRGRVLAEGDYATVANNPQVKEAYMGTGDAGAGHA